VSGNTTMKYADNAWLFFAVSIPLTLFTIIVWYSWANYMRMYKALIAKQEEHQVELTARLKAFAMFRRSPNLPR
jgi:hypothetical protein